jgi:hypothetical protein
MKYYPLGKYAGYDHIPRSYQEALVYVWTQTHRILMECLGAFHLMLHTRLLILLEFICLNKTVSPFCTRSMVIHSGIIYCLRKNNVYEENNYFYMDWIVFNGL